MTTDEAFRALTPLAWTFHRNTCRWTYNAAHTGSDGTPRPPAEHLDAPLTPLPPPSLDDTPALAALLRGRFSCRAFAPDPLGLDALATLLWAGYGVTGRTSVGALEFPERPVPSAGGLYPLEVYALVRAVDGLVPGIYHYAPAYHALERLRDVALPARFVTYLFMNQAYFAEAAAVLVVTAVTDRSLRRYADRGYRYLLLEAGHVGQNLDLAAVALGLGACNAGGFFDDELAGLLRADVEREVPLYAVAVGRRAPGDRERLRSAPLL